MSTPPDRPNPPQTSPYLRKSPPTKLPVADPALRQRARAAVMLAILSLLALFGAFGVVLGSNPDRSRYVDEVGIVIAVVAVWLAATTMRRARRAMSTGPGTAVFALVVGMIGLVITTLTLPGFSSDAPELGQYLHCVSAAKTTTARQACEQQAKNQIGILGG
jgi:4-amino-4-deoxy-L-arabinose transferase-like glycosyltransferase